MLYLIADQDENLTVSLCMQAELGLDYGRVLNYTFILVMEECTKFVSDR